MRVVLLICLFIALALNCSTSQEIEFKYSGWTGAKYSVGGSEFKSVDKNLEELKKLMGNCTECLKKLNSYSNARDVSIVFAVVGGVAIGIPAGGYIADGKWQDFYTPMLIGGVVLFVGSLIIEGNAVDNLKESGKLYNNYLKSKSRSGLSNLNFRFMVFENGFGIGVSYSF